MCFVVDKRLVLNKGARENLTGYYSIYYTHQNTDLLRFTFWCLVINIRSSVKIKRIKIKRQYHKKAGKFILVVKFWC